MSKSDNCFEFLAPADTQTSSDSVKYGFFCPKAKIFFQFSDINEYHSFLDTLKKHENSKTISATIGHTCNQNQDFGDFDYIVSEMEQKGRQKIYQQEMMIIEEF